jgi:hypothetical protein
VAERREMLLRHGVEVGRHLGVAGEPGGIAADQQDRRRIAALHGAQRIAEHADRRRAAVGVLRQPAQRKPELPGQIDSGVGRERKRRNRHALNVPGVQLGVLERRHNRIAHEGQRALARLRPPRVGRLADAKNGGVLEHALVPFRPLRLRC